MSDTVTEILKFDDMDLSELANLDVAELLAEMVQNGGRCDLSTLDSHIDLSDLIEAAVQNGPEMSR